MITGMKKICKSLYLKGLGISVFLVPLLSSATTDVNPGGGDSFSLQIVNPLSVGSLEGLLDLLLKILLQIGIPVVTFMIIWSGFLFIKAQGKEGEVTKAKENLQWVLIGTAIVLGVGSILAIIKTTVAALGGGV